MARILVAILMLWTSAGYGEKYVQKNNGLIPGLYQIKTSQKLKGYTVALLEAGTLGGSIFYFLKGTVSDAEATALYVDYLNLGPGLSPEVYDRYFKKAQDAERDAQKADSIKRRRKVLLLSSGAIYILNLLDVALYDQSRVSVSMVRGQTTITQVSFRF